MKRVTFLMCAILAFTFIGCTKSVVENTKKEPAADFRLSLYRGAANGYDTELVVNALNQSGAAPISAAYFEQNNRVRLKIGGIPTDTVVSRLSLDIFFSNKTKVSDVAGTYYFPNDNYKLDFVLRETVNGRTIRSSNPKRGYLSVTYDATTKSLSGNFDYIQFDGPLDYAYTFEELKGRFSNVKLSK